MLPIYIQGKRDLLTRAGLSDESVDPLQEILDDDEGLAKQVTRCDGSRNDSRNDGTSVVGMVNARERESEGARERGSEGARRTP